MEDERNEIDLMAQKHWMQDAGRMLMQGGLKMASGGFWGRMGMVNGLPVNLPRFGQQYCTLLLSCIKHSPASFEEVPDGTDALTLGRITTTQCINNRGGCDTRGTLPRGGSRKVQVEY